jgi:hypothetical protein
MEQITHDAIPTGRLWRNYALGWVAYMCLLGVALLATDTGTDHVHARIAGTALFSIPQALVLALLWPLGAWLERRRTATAVVLSIHIVGAFGFTALSYGSQILMFHIRQPLSWYVWPALYTMMMYGVVAAIFHTVRINAARRRQADTLHRAHALLVTSELNALRNKLNPHFLFNTLHSIIALTRRNPDAAEAALFQFSDMLRYVLDAEKNGDRVTLEDELNFVRDYLQLESLRLGNRLNVDWELDEDASRHALPALSLQPLVENSIKHAFNPHSRPGHLLIRTRVDAAVGTLAMTVGDDGPGADIGQVRASNGLGIRTVERRLQLEYGPAGALAIETAPGAGFVVTMSVPLAAS